MNHSRVYLDHNAGAPLRPPALAAMTEALKRGGNPSSVHAEGRLARAAVEDAREAVAALLGVSDENLAFTGGATEALATALQPRGEGRLLMSAVEHPAVLRGHGFPPDRVEVLPVDRDGVLDLAALDGALAKEGPVTLALQGANGETGVIQPVAEAASRVRAAGGVIVLDAAQTAGRLDIAAAVDLVAVSAHKLGGPAGVGALAWTSAGARPRPLIRGGGQERGMRAGTESIAGIVGFGVAARLALAERAGESARLAGLRERLEHGLVAINPATVVFSAGAERLPNTIAFAVPGISAEAALIALDLAGIAASSGSACSSGRVKPSHVLDAMAVRPDLRSGMIRFSLGWNTGVAEIEAALAAWSRVHGQLSAQRAA